MVRVLENLDPAFFYCLVLIEFLSGSDRTMILVLELLKSVISTYWYSVVSITVIRQETISLAFRNHSFRHPIEGRLTFRDISPVVIRTKRVNLLQSTVYQIHSLGKSTALVVLERSQNYLPNNRK